LTKASAALRSLTCVDGIQLRWKVCGQRAEEVVKESPLGIVMQV